MLSEPAHIVDLDVVISLDEVTHFLGYPEGRKPTEQVDSKLQKLKDEAIRVARPRGVFLELPPNRADEVQLQPNDASRLAIGLVTIGKKLENRVKEYINKNDLSAALLLDAIGSAAIENATCQLEVYIAEKIGLSACRLSPGYGNWPLDAQRDIFNLLPHENIGVSLTSSLLMIPMKSISFALFLGENHTNLNRSGCAHCGHITCSYRRNPTLT